MRYRIPIIILGAVFVLLTAGCATQQTRKDEALDQALQPILNSSWEESAPETGQVNGVAGPSAPMQKARSQVYYGSGELLAKPSGSAADNYYSEDGDGVSLNFNGIPLPEVVKAILGDILKESYSIEPGTPAGQLTLVTSRPVKRTALIPILESMLQTQGAGMVKAPGGTWRVGPRALLKGLAQVSPAEQVPGYNVRVVPLKYVGAAEMAKILEPFAGQDSILRVDATRNLLILGAGRDEMTNLLQTVETFDVDVFKGVSVGIFPVENVAPGQMVASLDSLFGKDGDSPLKGLFRIIPLDHAGRIMVVTSRAEHLKTISTWVQRLDFDDGSSSRLYVYQVQNGDAERLAELLSQLYGEGGKAGSARPKGDVAPGRSSMTQSSSGSSSASGTRSSAFGRSSGTDGGQGNTSGGLSDAGSRSTSAEDRELVSQAFGLTGEDGGGVRVVADRARNSLLILANGESYRAIENALRQLDIQPLQVLIEANIVEVTLSDELEYGLQWYFEHNVNGKTGAWGLDGNIIPGLAPKIPGFNWTLTDAAGVVNVVLSALAEDSRLRVISSPSILVLDNHTAQIRVGDQQPVATSETTNTSNTDVVTQNIEYKDTGVLLEVTPRVNAGGMVILDVAQEVTDVGEIDVATGQRTFLQRNFNSTVAVQSGQTMVLGGLIRDNSVESNAGVPLLKDIPVVGSLFGSTSNSGDRTELLVTLTPRAIRNSSEAKQAGEALREQMQGLLREVGR